MRMLGIDPGGKRLGLAVADDATGICSPIGVAAYQGVKHAARLIVETADEFGAEIVVIGLPTSAAGTETPACARTHALADALTILGVAVTLQSEYLTTDEARRRAGDSGRPVGQPVDDLAALVILEEYLEDRPPEVDPR